jgi:hypothetical protein
MNPTQKILNEADHKPTIIDKNGRRLLIRRQTALDTLRLFKAAGPVLSQNEPWLAMASLANSVQEIDGVPVPTPTSEAQIEALVERLGEDGLTAVAISVDEGEHVVAPELVGNLLGTPS